MKKLLILAALLPSLAWGEDVTIQHFEFGPQAVTVKVGTKVTWINKDIEPHTVVSNDHKFQSEALDTGDTFSVTFDKAGSYGYFCTIHPHMTGTVTVLP